MDDDRAVIICVTIGGETDLDSMTYGSVTGTCAICGVGLWVSRTSIKFMAQRGAQTVCGKCGAAIQAEEGVFASGFIPGQLDEVESIAGKEGRLRVEQAIAHLNRRMGST